jgi:hypothetical protein
MVEQPVAQRTKRSWRERPVYHHHELVAAEPCHEVSGSHRFEESIGNVLQEAVSGDVAERIVDQFEAIEVDEQHRGVRAIANEALQMSVEPRSIREASERITSRLKQQRIRGLTLLGDVFQ